MKRFKIINNKKDLDKRNSCFFMKFRFHKKTFFKKNNFESLRRLISRKVKKKIKYSLNKKTNKFPLYKKSQKSRMGKGKGKFNNWIWSLKKNETIFEMSFFKKKKIIHFFLKKLKKKISTNFIISYRVYNI